MEYFIQEGDCCNGAESSEQNKDKWDIQPKSDGRQWMENYQEET